MDALISIPSTEPLLVSVAIPRPLDGLFSYLLPSEWAEKAQVGGWVKVPFGRKEMHGFLMEKPKPLSELPAGLERSALKAVREVGSGGAVVPEDVLQLCRWASDYYRAPIGEILNAAVPSAALGLKNKKEARSLSGPEPVATPPPRLTGPQEAALQEMERQRNLQAPSAARVCLLHGVTGSGKTELYLELARRTLAEGKSVLLLVPEIALTPQLHQRFEAGLGVRVGLWHSALADGVRRDQFAALRSGQLRVVVGARSAVFAPLKDLGLIVIDEEHDSTYKQEDRVRYHARDLAVVRSKLTGAFVVLGSATPSLESRERVREGRYGLAELKERIAAGGLPRVELVDLKEVPLVEGTQAALAQVTLDAIRDTVAQGGQAMVFLNRRGFASFLVCKDCGEVAGCPDCSISLTFHKRRAQLKCHVCGHFEGIPDQCPKCQGLDLLPIGAGTESLEDDLPRLLEGLRTLRLDRDVVTSASRLDSILSDFRAGKADVLLGTQMLVKGHDFPGVTLVVVVLADGLFRWPDFRAPERALQVLTQVAGRAGRGEHPGRVLIQTFLPEHPVLQVVQGNTSEEEFLGQERELREVLGYPPFGRLARLRFEDSASDEARAHAERVLREVRRFSEANGGSLEVLGPSEAFLEKAKGIFRWDALLRSRDIRILQRSLSIAKDVAAVGKFSLQIDVDPHSVG